MMNRRLNHFLVRTVLANIFECIYKATAYIRVISVKLTWLVFLGISLKLALHFAATGDMAMFFEDHRNIGGAAALFTLVMFNLAQPKLTLVFAWVLRTMYQFDDAEIKSL